MSEIINKINKMISGLGKESVIIAIDGRCGAGKTTLANEMKEEYDASLIYMDDFFLPLELRTENRFNEPGGNIHYERFYNEVVSNIGKEIEFNYGLFNCSTMKCDSTVKVIPSKITIVEGSYSQHPYFGDYADVRIFCDISPNEQIKRIIKRDGERKAEIFTSRWIPLEEKYFSAFKIKESADIIVS